MVNLFKSDAELIQSTSWQTYQKMKIAGGYFSTPKPPKPDAPKLPLGRKPSIKELEGLWVGTFKFYPVPWDTKIELTLRMENGEWKADMKIKFEGHPDSNKTPIVTSFQITETGISFLDSTGINGIPIKYQAVFTGKSLVGITEYKTNDENMYAIGTWRLKRQNRND